MRASQLDRNGPRTTPRCSKHWPPEFLRHTVAEWCAKLDLFDVPNAPVNSIKSVFEEPQAKFIGLELSLEHEIEGRMTTVAPAVKFAGMLWADLQPPPVLGQHTDEVLAELGLSPEVEPKTDVIEQA